MLVIIFMIGKNKKSIKKKPKTKKLKKTQLYWFGELVELGDGLEVRD